LSGMCRTTSPNRPGPLKRHSAEKASNKKIAPQARARHAVAPPLRLRGSSQHGSAIAPASAFPRPSPQRSQEQPASLATPRKDALVIPRSALSPRSRLVSSSLGYTLEGLDGLAARAHGSGQLSVRFSEAVDSIEIPDRLRRQRLIPAAVRTCLSGLGLVSEEPARRMPVRRNANKGSDSVSSSGTSAAQFLLHLLGLGSCAGCGGLRRQPRSGAGRHRVSGSPRRSPRSGHQG